jgi:Protein of unknown function (DUF3667)
VVVGGFEAAGDAITGALFGRAVEPERGEGTAEGAGACLNCGTALIGRHCHACGQKAEVHRTLRSYGHDLLHGVFHFEGKIWKTLPMLAVKPGELTRRYIHGERAKFVSPLALFLFAVFLMFAVVGGLAGEMHAPDTSELKVELRGKPLSELEAEIKKQTTQQALIDAQIKKIEAADGDTTALEKQSKKFDTDIDNLETARNLLTGKPNFTVTDLKTGWPALDAGLDRANKNPNLFLYKIQSSAYKYSWALIPLSVPFVWLLFFWRRQFKMYDHAVFVTYSLTFMLFLTVVLTVIGFAGAAVPWVPIAGTFIPPIHMYRQLRGAYGVSAIGALVRTMALASFGTIVLTVFLVLLMLLGALG